jgi:VWFA-related protein
MKLLRIALFSIAVLAAGTSGFSRQASPAAKDAPAEDTGERIKVDVSIVNVLCSVQDGKGRFIPDLQKSAFEIKEDGKPQQILYFTQETKLPLTLGLLVDTSVSQGRLIADEQRAASQFFEQVLGKNDQAFLISFDVNVDLLQDMTGSPDFLRHALGGIHVNGGGAGMPGPFPNSSSGGTHLHDAVYLASNDVLQKEVGRKAIILITDGEDQGSQLTKLDAIRSAQKADVIVYGILFLDREFYGFHGYSGADTLKSMSEETGGRIFRAENDQQLADAFDQISIELRSQYSLGYHPTNETRNGSYRKIDVKARQGGSNLRVHARKGYYAPQG